MYWCGYVPSDRRFDDFFIQDANTDCYVLERLDSTLNMGIVRADRGTSKTHAKVRASVAVSEPGAVEGEVDTEAVNDSSGSEDGDSLRDERTVEPDTAEQGNINDIIDDLFDEEIDTLQE